MSRPPLITRVAGSPLPAVLLFAGYAAIIAGWYEGQAAWWLALMAAGASVRTLSAVARVRRYKAWLAEWNAMGQMEQPAPKPKRGSRRWIFIIGALLLLLAIPASSPYMQSNDTAWAAAVTMWIAALVYLTAVILRSITRRRTKRPKAGANADAVPVVECMLGRAPGSPSRADAARQLPEYTHRLLSA